MTTTEPTAHPGTVRHAPSSDVMNTINTLGTLANVLADYLNEIGADPSLTPDDVWDINEILDLYGTSINDYPARDIINLASASVHNPRALCEHCHNSTNGVCHEHTDWID